MLCNKCEKGNCDYFSQENSSCVEYVTCTCQYNVNGVNDFLQKVSAIGGGIITAGAGIGLSVASGGLLIPFVSGPMVGVGFSSVIKGIEKFIKKEKIEAKDYLLEVGFGAATGVFTGGVGAVG